MSAWYKAEKWNFMFTEAWEGGKIQLFSNYSHVEQHQRRPRKTKQSDGIIFFAAMYKQHENGLNSRVKEWWLGPITDHAIIRKVPHRACMQCWMYFSGLLALWAVRVCVRACTVHAVDIKSNAVLSEESFQQHGQHRCMRQLKQRGNMSQPQCTSSQAAVSDLF